MDDASSEDVLKEFHSLQKSSAEVNFEIKSATARIAQKLKSLDEIPETPEYVNRQYDLINNSFDTLQTSEHEELLNELIKWTKGTKVNYEEVDYDYLNQVEDWQQFYTKSLEEKVDGLEHEIGTFDGYLDQMKDKIDYFHNKMSEFFSMLPTDGPCGIMYHQYTPSVGYYGPHGAEQDKIKFYEAQIRCFSDALKKLQELLQGASAEIKKLKQCEADTRKQLDDLKTDFEKLHQSNQSKDDLLQKFKDDRERELELQKLNRPKLDICKIPASEFSIDGDEATKSNENNESSRSQSRSSSKKKKSHHGDNNNDEYDGYDENDENGSNHRRKSHKNQNLSEYLNMVHVTQNVFEVGVEEIAQYNEKVNQSNDQSNSKSIEDDEKYKDLLDQFNKLNEENKSLKDAVEASSSDDELKKLIEKLTKEKEDLADHLKQIEDESKQLQDKLDEAEKEKESLSSKLDEAGKENEKLNNKMQENEKEKENLKNKLNEAEKENDKLNNKMQEKEKEKDELKKKLDQADTQIKNINQKNQTLKEKLDKTQEDLGNSKEELDDKSKELENKSKDGSNDESGEKSNNESGEKSNGESGEKSNNESGEKSNDESGEKSNNESGEKSNDESGEKSNDESGGKSNGESGGKSNDPKAKNHGNRLTDRSIKSDVNFSVNDSETSTNVVFFERIGTESSQAENETAEKILPNIDENSIFHYDCSMALNSQLTQTDLYSSEIFDKTTYEKAEQPDYQYQSTQIDFEPYPLGIDNIVFFEIKRSIKGSSKSSRNDYLSNDDNFIAIRTPHSSSVISQSSFNNDGTNVRDSVDASNVADGNAIDDYEEDYNDVHPPFHVKVQYTPTNKNFKKLWVPKPPSSTTPSNSPRFRKSGDRKTNSARSGLLNGTIESVDEGRRSMLAPMLGNPPYTEMSSEFRPRYPLLVVQSLNKPPLGGYRIESDDVSAFRRRNSGHTIIVPKRLSSLRKKVNDKEEVKKNNSDNAEEAK